MQQSVKNIITEEKGSVLPMVLLMLALLTVVGVTSINQSVIESQIVRNDVFYKEHFFLADSAVNEAMQRIMNASDQDLRTINFSWLLDSSGTSSDDMEDISNWVFSGAMQNCVQSTLDPDNNTFITVIDEGGDTMDATQPSKHTYTIIALNRVQSTAAKNRGQVMIRAAMRKKVYP